MAVGIGFSCYSVVRSSNFIERLPCVYSTANSREGPGGEAPSGSVAACQSVHDPASNSSLGKQDAVLSLKRSSGFRETRPMTSFSGKVKLNYPWENAQRKPCS